MPVVTELEFRIAVPQRQPAGRAEATYTAAIDEADSIRDPVFRSIYRASRRKANA
jgi:hypothetical protein